MRREYVKPTVIGEMFTANEYCSSCGPTGETTYKFVCDAPAGNVYYYDKTGYKHGLGGYTPCGATHEVTVKDTEELPFYKGFVDRDGDGEEDANANPTESSIIWVNRFLGITYNWHASAAYSDINDIETLKS